ncbi:hypothetical protein IIC38_16875 [candidate division KSB1 bacterium]|nr:hypothetical protein [candidate division KSB1 bacterium]
MIGITILHYTTVDKSGEGWNCSQHTFNSGDSILIGQTILHYKIIEKLGEGGHQSRASYAWESKR